MRYDQFTILSLRDHLYAKKKEEKNSISKTRNTNSRQEKSKFGVQFLAAEKRHSLKMYIYSKMLGFCPIETDDKIIDRQIHT